MYAKILNIFAKLRASYWFVPTVLSLLAIIIAGITLWVDYNFGKTWLEKTLPWLPLNQPDGARTLLGMVAGSMMTVAGVSFSITIVAVSFATGRIGPRLMNHFMRDRTNQLTLGTFIATFIYCLIVLQTVISGEEAKQPDTDAIEAFVPHYSIFTAITLTILSLGVFIHYLHHIPRSISVSDVLSRIGNQLMLTSDQLFPQKFGDAAEEYPMDQDGLPDDFYEKAIPVPANCNSYIQVVDEGHLLDIANEHNLLLRVQYRPGDFVYNTSALLYYYPYEKNNDTDEAELLKHFRSAYAFGDQRTRQQNITFLVDELAEIIGIALSPGVNDPFTAITALDWLQSMFHQLSQAATVSPYRFQTQEDDHQVLRAVVHGATYETLLKHVYERISQYVAADANTCLRFFTMLAELAAGTPGATRKRFTVELAHQLVADSLPHLPLESSRETLKQRQQEFMTILEDGAKEHTQRAKPDTWFGGTA